MIKHRNVHLFCFCSSRNPKCFRSFLVRFTAERVSCQEKCCCVAGHWLKQMSVWATTRFISEMYSVANGLGHMTAGPRWEIDELWIFHAHAGSALFKVRPGVAWWEASVGLLHGARRLLLGGVQLLGVHGGRRYYGVLHEEGGDRRGGWQACLGIVLNIPRDTCSCCGNQAGAALSAPGSVNCALNQ